MVRLGFGESKCRFEESTLACWCPKIPFKSCVCLASRSGAKKRGVAYFSHLMGVAAIVLEYGGDETTAVAALLHDAVEDQGGEATDKLIERVFGGEVSNLVRAVSEDNSLPWTERKRAYIDRISTETTAARLICAADKLHNLRTTAGDHCINQDGARRGTLGTNHFLSLRARSPISAW